MNVIREKVYQDLLNTFVLVISGLIFVSPVLAQQSGWRHAGKFERLYNPSTVQSISGRVERLEKAISTEQMTHGLHLIVKTEDQTWNVHLGPLWYFESQDLRFRSGDQVVVEGSVIELEGESFLIASKISRGEETYQLRDSAGTPVWSGWRRKNTAGVNTSCVLEGVILDSSGRSIPDAVVMLEPGLESVKAGRDGSFCFTQADPATDTLMVSAIGFEQKQNEIRLTGNQPTEINFILAPAVVAETVLVTAATRTLKKLEEVPVRTEVILPEIIEMSAARNLADAVEFNTGLRVENNCQNCNFSQIRMLGLEGKYTQILFDGQPTMSSLAQVYGVEQIPSSMVERIEVVKGGGSSIYGPGSVGGVLNVIPHTPSQTSGTIMGRAGWMDGKPNQTFGAGVDWASTSGDSSMNLYGQYDKMSPVDFDDDGFTEVGKRDFGAVGVRFNQIFMEQKGKLTLDFNHINEDRRGGDLLNRPPDEANIAEAVESKRTAGGISWHHTPTTKFDYRLGLSFADLRRDTYYGAGQDPNAYGESNSPFWIVDSQFNHFFSSHVLSWGSQISVEGLDDQQPAYDRFYEETYTNFGIFVQDDWFFLSNWELIYGARVDKHSEIKNAIFSPRVALKWSAKPTLNLRTSVATGFLAPQIFDEDLHITQVGGEGQIHRNSEDLKQESSTTITGGMEWRPNWGTGVGLIEFNLFHTEIRDLFHLIEDDDPETEEVEFTRINFGTAKVYGAEINIGYALSNALQLEAGYVEQRSKFGEEEPDFGSIDFFRTPNRYGLATLIYRNPKLVDVFFGARFTGEMKVPHYAGYIPEDRLETSPAYATIDASVSKAFPFGSDSEIVFTIGGKNLTNYYQDDLDQGPDRDAGYLWGPRFPRMIYLSTAIQF